MIVLSVNQRYSYSATGIKFTGPHTHTVTLGCEPKNDDCAGCWIVPDDATVDIVRKSDDTVKGSFREPDVRSTMIAVPRGFQ